EVADVIVESAAARRIDSTLAATPQRDGHQVILITLGERGRDEIPVSRRAVPSVHEQRVRGARAAPFADVEIDSVGANESLDARRSRPAGEPAGTRPRGTSGSWSNALVVTHRHLPVGEPTRPRPHPRRRGGRTVPTL